MNSTAVRTILLASMLIAAPAIAQHHMSNWVYSNAADTTIVPCLTDSLTSAAIPPGSMSMMMPSTMYMHIDEMPMDSLTIPHDSTVIGWCRIRAGSDSMHFTMMNGGMGGGGMMMQFQKSIVCRFHWDSVTSDSAHRRWHVTGLRTWNGSSWTNIGGVTLSGNEAEFQSSDAFAIVAFVGAGNVTDVREGNAAPLRFSLGQNFPNPFNPTTTIEYSVPVPTFVRLDLYNILGGKSAALVNGVEPEGVHQVKVDGSRLPSGIYFYRLQAGSFIETRKMMLLK